MESMVNGEAQTGTWTSDVFQVGQLDYVQFYAKNITAGTVTFQGSVDNSAWDSLDPTNLALTADGFRTARLGNIYVRASGSTTNVTDVFISGPYVERFT